MLKVPKPDLGLGTAVPSVSTLRINDLEVLPPSGFLDIFKLYPAPKVIGLTNLNISGEARVAGSWGDERMLGGLESKGFYVEFRQD
jgi:hypothetical protein